MALIKGKLIDPSTVIKQLQDPSSDQDLSRKGYVDAKAVAEALSARLQAESFATSAASSAEISAKSYADQKISDLVNGAPEMLDTLKELADALEASEGAIEAQILEQVGALDGRLDIIEGPDSQVGSIAKALKDAKAYTDSEVSAEESRAQGEEQRIESKFDEMFSYQESTNLLVDERITTEIADREAGDSALDLRLDVLEGADTVEGSVAKAEKDAKDYADSQISAEQSRAEGEEQRIEQKFDEMFSYQESTNLVVDERITTEIADREAADNALDSRIDSLESAPKPQGRKEVKTMSSTDISNAYVDLSNSAMSNTMLVSVSGTVQYEGEDYTLSTVGGVTRVTFIGDLTPDGDGAALVVGDKVHFQYLVMSV